MFGQKKEYRECIKRKNNIILGLEKEIAELKQELLRALDLRGILAELSTVTKVQFDKLDTLTSSCGGCDMTAESAPDFVAVYVDDLFGGTVIRQEANKAILISEDGVVTEGVTASDCNKGHSYKLVRE